ncbi:MAG TPA: alkaline phosphatase family protein [Caulobacteraceae bacterium]|nr:alkaline phosphatase family protein [Caulobacteraceae bacterium]
MRKVLILIGLVIAAASLAACSGHPRRNVVIFVADGLRYGIVDDTTAPELMAVRREGVDFAESHALYPTVTTPNASAIATGHYLGDTGDFSNQLYFPGGLPAPVSAVVAPVEDDAALRLMNQATGGNYLNEQSFLAAARARGYRTAVVGKLGPAGVQDLGAFSGQGVLIDDATGWPSQGFPEGVDLPADVKAAIKAAGLKPTAPDRGLNSDPGAYNMPGVRVANVEQQDWFTRVVTGALLPMFKKDDKPFVLVFWSRDPDGTQHNEGDSLGTLDPGINGPTSLAGVRNASKDLGAIRKALHDLGLEATTDVFVTADHGFSTISRQSRTSAAAKMSFRDVAPGQLPPGFLAIDLSKSLGLALHDANGLDVDLAGGFHPKRSSAILGPDPKAPQVVIGSNGGTDLIWLPTGDRAALARRIVAALAAEDYTAAIFAADDLGPIPGTLPTSAIGLKGSARTEAPAIVVSFRSWSGACPRLDACAVEVADTDLQQGQGIHGAFQRGDTRNFMAAVGPDFRRGFVDRTPVGNADIVPTLAHAIGLPMPAKGTLTGRVITEALARDGKPVAGAVAVERSAPGPGGFVTVLKVQTAGGRRYFDAAGWPGRVWGLDPRPAAP